MSVLIEAAAPLVLLGLILLGLKTGVLRALGPRPLVTLAAAIVAGELWRRGGLPPMDAELVREATRLLLALLVFFAAQQCRASRLWRVSPAAFRLGLFAAPVTFVIVAALGFLVVPGLSFSGTLIVAAALAFGGAPAIDKLMLRAPLIADSTKGAARLEGAATLVALAPVAILLELAAYPPLIGAQLIEEPLVSAMAGFTVGGVIGLLAGRKIPLGKAALPALPFVVILGVVCTALFLGFDVVMAAAGAGLLFSEEARIPGAVRTRLWRTGERIISPFAFAALGFVLGPVILRADFLMWVVAVIAVTLARAAPRFLVLKGTDVAPQDRFFLAWYGGAPGAGSALFLLSLLASPAVGVEDQPVVLGAVVVLAGLIAVRLGSGPLTTRLVHETDRAKKRRYFPA